MTKDKLNQTKQIEYDINKLESLLNKLKKSNEFKLLSENIKNNICFGIECEITTLKTKFNSL